MKQIIIVSEDRPGVVAEVSEAMAAAGVNIETIDAETIAGSGVTIMTVDKYDDALRALAQTPFHALSEDAVVVQLDDHPGELARVTRRLKEANINLRSIRIIRREGGRSIVAIGTERTRQTMELLKDVLVSNFTRDE
ncbi:MAG: ACT domain-containing protein [Pirellulaceae bacterium]|nr:ACT domain-containing protein [Pirellulaceae bacterium]